MEERWRTRKGLAEEKLLEINAQKREGIKKEMKNFVVCYDTSESAAMIDFYRIRGAFPQ